MNEEEFALMSDTKKLDEIHRVLGKSDRTALAFGMFVGQLSGILNDLNEKRVQQAVLYKELRDIWKAAGMQLHAIYYKDSLLDNLEALMNSTKGAQC